MFLTLVLLTACTNQKADEGDGGGGCNYTGTELSVDEVSSLGFAASEPIAAMSGPRSETLHWTETDTTSPLSFELTASSGVRLMEGEWTAPDTGDNSDTGETICPPYLEIDATLQLSTEDGGFAENLDVVVDAHEASGVELDHELTYEDLSGSWVSSSFDPDEVDDIALDIHAEVSADTCTGEVLASAHKSMDDGQASDSLGMIAEWPPAE